MTTRLAATRVAALDSPDHALVMLHGIYGRGRNWQAIAKGVVAQRPEYGCWLVDLPYHGASPPATHGDSVSGLAQDVREWLDAEGVTPNAILGHSYGGKVVLAMAAQGPGARLQVWVIDSTPEVKPPSGSAWGMLEVIRGLPSRFESREQAAQALVEHGYAPGVGQWMATNLVREDDGFVWALDFEAMERLLRDFFATDLWSVLEAPAPGLEIHIVKASESSAISDAAVARIEAASCDRVILHHRQGGHWIHAESPQVITELLVSALP